MTKTTQFIGILGTTTFVAGFSLGLGFISGLIVGSFTVNHIESADKVDDVEEETSK